MTKRKGQLGDPIARGQAEGLPGFHFVDYRPPTVAAEPVCAEWLVEISIRLASLSRSSRASAPSAPPKPCKDSTPSPKGQQDLLPLSGELEIWMQEALRLVQKARRHSEARYWPPERYPAFFTTKEMMTCQVAAGRGYMLITSEPVRWRAEKKWKKLADALVKSAPAGTILPNWFPVVDASLDPLDGEGFFSIAAIIALMSKQEEFTGKPLNLRRSIYAPALSADLDSLKDHAPAKQPRDRREIARKGSRKPNKPKTPR